MRWRFATALVVSLGLVFGLAYFLRSDRVSPQAADGQGETLLFHCAAGIRLPVSEIVAEYEKTYGVTIQTNFDGSGKLLGQLPAAGGDLYLAADVTYHHEARNQGLVREIVPIAFQRPVIAVAKGNPHNISSLDDLKGNGIQLSLAKPEVAAISRVARRLINENAPGSWDSFWQAVDIQRSTVNEVANDIKLKTADAGIVWDATAAQYPELEIVPIPELQGPPNQITIGVMESCSNPTRALHFVRYMTSRDRGLPVFARFGYETVRGDKWAEKPELHIFSGGLNRPAIEKTIAEFEKREGVTVLATYNGCGVLVGQMKAGARPDLYFACDTSFMDSVADLFVNPTKVSKTAMVIITEKGNPQNIRTLEDLARPGLKLALCDPQKSALGKLTDDLLDKYGLKERVRANQQYSSATADNCVQAIAVGRMDAAIVYKANAAFETERLEVIPIEDPQAVAVQPIAVSRESDYPLLTKRLMQRIMSAESRSTFDRLGYEWLLP